MELILFVYSSFPLPFSTRLGLGIVGNTVSSGTSGVPVIGSGSSAIGPGSTSASAIVAATLGIGLHQQQQQHHGLLSSVSGSGSAAATPGANAGGSLGMPIPSPTPHATENPLVEVEFNLWTRPDCAGTPYENQNRTWFHFAVTGGRPNQIVKFNVMNLNKQAKLFSQGMHPVTKVGPNGRWERIKDKPSYSVSCLTLRFNEDSRAKYHPFFADYERCVLHLLPAQGARGGR